MITLVEVKEYLNIDFDDYDSMLQTMLDASIDRAKTLTGLDEDNFNSEIKLAILNDIAFAYQSRGEKESTSASATETYRRRSVRPML